MPASLGGERGHRVSVETSELDLIGVAVRWRGHPAEFDAVQVGRDLHRASLIGKAVTRAG
jgi:hypothetical protein